jgi:hypothetical protein
VYRLNGGLLLSPPFAQANYDSLEPGTSLVITYMPASP